MKRIKLFEQFTEESVNEKKVDGTISDDEAEREDELMTNIKSSMDDLSSLIKKDERLVVENKLFNSLEK